MLDCWRRVSMALGDKTVYNPHLYEQINGFIMISRTIGVLATSIILTACGGSGSSGSSEQDKPTPPVTPPATPPVTPPVKETFSPEAKTLEAFKFVDALNKPLASADVVFVPVSNESNSNAPLSRSALNLARSEITCAVITQPGAVSSTTTESGELSLEGLGEGTYQVHICKSGINVSIKLNVLGGNASSSTGIAVPVITDEDGDVTELPDTNILIAISGVIYSDEGVVSNAQVSLSGGSLTNGSIVATMTDEDGFYSIVANVNKDKISALKNASLQIVAEGFERLNVSAQDFTEFSAYSGINLKLSPTNESASLLVYEENFEILSAQAACGAWTSEALEIDSLEEGAPNEAASALLAGNTVLPSLWHSHDSGLDIINQAYVQGLVLLAPNDTSEAKVPDPIEGNKACWYGSSATDGSLVQGNILNEASEDQTLVDGVPVGNPNGEPQEVPELAKLAEDILNGGTSTRAHAGALISPRMDFSSETAPLALSFKTWWEIEAVNPNELGYDLMSVEYQIEGEETWNTFVRLNPLTDPQGFKNKAALPFSNGGFNLAPFWVEQAPISLNRLAGKVFKLRFTFSTEDHLYNGFRGWLIDDVKISKQEGTFPLWDEVDRIFRDDEGDEFSRSREVGSDQTEFAIKLEVRSQNATLAQFRMYDQNGEPLSSSFGKTVLNKGETQDIHVVGKVVEPEVGYRLMVELVDASGRVWSNAQLFSTIESDGSDEE